MKRSGILRVVAIVLFAMALPSIAAAQYGEERLDKWLNGHQDVKAELARDPGLLYNRKWRHEHPGLQQFMQANPQVWGKIPSSGRYGAYGPDNHWHDADWWHQNNPGWINQNHPEWATNHPEWGHAEAHPMAVEPHAMGAEPHAMGAAEPAAVPPHHHHHPVQ